MTKSQLRIKQVSLLTHYIKRYKQQNELWETVRLTSFLKNWDCDPFQSSSSLFICAFFFIIPSLNVLSPYFNMSINLVSALTVWILINFMKQLLQLLLPLQTITGQLPPPPPPFLHLLPYNQINNTSMTDCINISIMNYHSMWLKLTWANWSCSVRVKRDPLDGAAAPDALSKSQANQFSKKPLMSFTKVPTKVQTHANWLLKEYGAGGGY